MAEIVTMRDGLFIPRDATLPPLPPDDEIMDGEDGAGAAALWDRLMPDQAGMLTADQTYKKAS